MEGRVVCDSRSDVVVSEGTNKTEISDTDQCRVESSGEDKGERKKKEKSTEAAR